MIDKPRVFGEGTITVTVNKDGFRIYIGTLELDHVTQAQIDLSMLNEPDIFIKISSENMLETDENMRIVKTLPWVKLK